MKYVFLILAFISFPSFAIDNPDAPDRLMEFKERISQYENKIENSNTTLDLVQAYSDYEKALDKELNQSYQLLLSNLDAQPKNLLKATQRKWISYRDAEFSYINENWNKTNFGTSFAISRGAYKTELIKSRVIQLIQYTANY